MTSLLLSLQTCEGYVQNLVNLMSGLEEICLILKSIDKVVVLIASFLRTEGPEVIQVFIHTGVMVGQTDFRSLNHIVPLLMSQTLSLDLIGTTESDTN